MSYAANRRMHKRKIHDEDLQPVGREAAASGHSNSRGHFPTGAAWTPDPRSPEGKRTLDSLARASQPTDIDPLQGRPAGSAQFVQPTNPLCCSIEIESVNPLRIRESGIAVSIIDGQQFR